MKKPVMVVPLVLLCCFAMGCLQRRELAEEPVPDVEADIQAIKDIVADYEAGVNSADMDRYLQHYAGDAIFVLSRRY